MSKDVEDHGVVDWIDNFCLWLFRPVEPHPMFGYQGGESRETVARKREYIADAQHRWPFLTRYDFTTIHNEQQFARMVRDRTAMPKEQADDAVHKWMEGKTF